MSFNGEIWGVSSDCDMIRDEEMTKVYHWT